MVTSQSMRRGVVGCFAAMVVGVGGANAFGYVPGERWTTTAWGSTGSMGDPATVSWSIARNGTSIPEEGASNLVTFLDGIFNHTTGGTNFATRPWFSLIQDSFNRWSSVSGINFVYEPNDGSASLVYSAGVQGVRGDIRIGGQNIDGAGNTLAYAYYPDVGDIVVDTSELSFFSASANNYRALRNTLMHEIGHAFGLDHVESSSDSLLMEPSINSSIDGPQLDDIRGVQRFYGDALEKTNAGAGNDSASLAHSLGALTHGGTVAIGSHALGGQSVAATETDFVSISGTSDVDFYSFTISAASLLSATLTPLGGVFTQGAQGGSQSPFNASGQNDLSLALFGTNGTTLVADANLAAAGSVESLTGVELLSPGQYFVRVQGGSDAVQLYQLQLTASAYPQSLEGDYNVDGVVNAADYILWRKSAGQNGNGQNGMGDYATWQANYGNSGSGGGSSGVPEPDAMLLLMACVVITVGSGAWARGCQH